MRRVLVIGGGITGVAAAHRLRQLMGSDADIIVAEGADRLGGKIHSVPFAGQTVETGAESLLAARPEPQALAAEVGLELQWRRPGPHPAALYLEGQLRPFPAQTFMGLPANVETLSDYLSDEGREEATRPRPDHGPLLKENHDRTIGELVTAELGPEVRDRILEPILAGVYAGDLNRLSVRAVMPQLATKLTEHSRLTDAVGALLPAPNPDAPKRQNPLATIDGGLSRLVKATAEAAKAELRLRTTVRELRRHGKGWLAVCGPVPAPTLLEVDAVVVAVPAAPAARLLTAHAPTATEALNDVDYASVALATFAFPANTKLPENSGFLIPATEDSAIKAATFFTQKWPHLARPDYPAVMRVSMGRYGDEQTLHRTDSSLADLALSHVQQYLGTDLGEPLKWRVNRWGGGLPQYTVGHVERMQQARTELSEIGNVALAGASTDGVGIAACIASGRRAAEDIASPLTDG